MTTISSTTILRSRNLAKPDKVLSTLLLRYPRFIHAEFMTHRVMTRNAASSRAIPIKKLIQDVVDNPVVPLFWGKNQPGMQAGEECTSEVGVRNVHLDYDEENTFGRTHDLVSREAAWLEARAHAVEAAQAFADAGYHKQIVNRLLEPFAHITVLVSSTEWENFLELRDDPAAEPHIQVLAREIRKCLEDESTIQDLKPGEWHLPFITPEELASTKRGSPTDPLMFPGHDVIQLSAARCASTSFKTVDGFDMTFEKAEEIFDKLVTSKPIHASPFEHVAEADAFYADKSRWATPQQHGNFVGFRQYRHML
ncbi:FAD-dependent thymidylate synthase [Ancylobacter rudongensis]|uniref:Thymidylate synthase complementing protein n=1 Tax=Ancylobacter rudongensis TaxID=177413 RepID=A0A1G4UQT2_9HYPH|nr:FAD-dependent thymidylate synthase [Ancylobacter rudongensis]SCW95907.1 Thymidylate synthase complementing protein [Ancylobacter rudongensis]